MSLAKLDHVIWKVNTYLSVAKREPAFKFVDHKNCRLGKWYSEGLGKRYFSETPSYSQLDRPHSIVHNGTHHVFETISKDGDLDYGTLLKSFKEMEDASGDVFKLLDKILHERD
ncbi:MAG: CZB domain-containing protein [Campylobacterota bacterium]|nr:CZB domain-containing protein [Campylobacterota bacterium]